MKQLLYILIAIALIGGGYYYFTMDKNEDMVGESMESMNDDNMEMKDGDTSMDDHMKMMNDGKTVMIMGGAASPAVLNVAPGAELRLANHENVPLTLVFGGNAVQVAEVAAGAEGTFKAPMQVGRYEYVVSTNPTVTGVIVVEE